MVENLDDRLGIFGARFPYFERRFQFLIEFIRTPGSSPFLGLSNPYWTFWAHIGRILDARPDAEMQNKKPPIWRSGTRPGAGRVFGGIHVRINKQHSSQAWRLAAAGVTTGGAAVQTGAGDGERRQHTRQRSTASTGNLHDCGVSLKRLRGGRTKGRRSSPSWPRWQAAQVAGKLAIPFTRFKVPAIFIWSFGWLPQMAEGRRAFHPFQGASERGWEISSHLICLSLKKYLSGTGSVSMRGSFDARV